jgi:hypothetical protein
MTYAVNPSGTVASRTDQVLQPLYRHIVITHFGTWFFKNVAASERKLESLGNVVRVITAYDGMHLDVRFGRKRHDRILRFALVWEIPCYRWGRDSEFYCLYRGIR